MFTVLSNPRNSKLFLIGASAIMLITLALTACIAGVTATQVGPTPTMWPTPVIQPTPTYIINHIPQVLEIEIQMLGSDPGQVNAIVRGNLLESCATLREPHVEYVANTFQIGMYAAHSGDRYCWVVLTPFEKTIPLPTSGLPAGTYSVVVNNDAGTTFTLPVANAPDAVLAVQPNPQPVPQANPQSCVDAAKFVTDVTVPDNSLIAPNTAFYKTWRLKNTGTCTWDDNYLVSYISGTGMTQDNAYYIVERGQRVAPGQTVDITVGMTSPVQNGTYQTYWGLKKENGGLIPIQGGAKGNSFFVKIKVEGIPLPDVDGQITSAETFIGLDEGSLVACTPDSIYYVPVHITADGPTSAHYEISALAGNFQNVTGGVLGSSVTGTLVFDEAGTKTIDWLLVGPYLPYHDDISVYTRVNGREFPHARVSCQQ